MKSKPSDIKQRILVVDDDHQIGELLYEFLDSKGFDVLYADNGTQGVDLLKRARPHIVLLDVKMKDVNGLEVLRRMVEIDPKVVVIMITALHENEVGRQALELGAVDFITKPIDLGYLAVSIEAKLADLFS